MEAQQLGIPLDDDWGGMQVRIPEIEDDIWFGTDTGSVPFCLLGGSDGVPVGSD